MRIVLHILINPIHKEIHNWLITIGQIQTLVLHTNMIILLCLYEA